MDNKIPGPNASIEQTPSKFEAISPTASVIAYLRALTTDIRYAKELAEKTDLKKIYEAFGGNNQDVEFALYMEARWKTIQELMEKIDNKQTLELGAGLSPRAIINSENPDQSYFETDLPKPISDKKELEKGILKAERPNLHVEQLDATSSEEFENIEQELNPGRVTVISEGLLPYLNRDALNKICNNIKTLLEKHGGAWITDIATRKALTKTSVYQDHSTELLASLYKNSEVGLSDIGFEDGKDAQNFFESYGFKIEKHNLHSVSDTLHTPQVLNLSKGRIDYLLSSPVVWVLTL